MTAAPGSAFVITAGPVYWNLHEQGRFPKWRIGTVVDGLPPGATFKAFGRPEDWNRRFAILTSCLTPPGDYTLTFHSNGDHIQESAQARLTIGPKPVQETPMGIYTATETIDIRYGGPSTMEGGIRATVTVCDADRLRLLRITVLSAISRAGTRMEIPPGYGLYRELDPFAEKTIQRLDYQNAIPEPAANYLHDWALSGGPYIIVFGTTRYASRPRPEEEVASVTYKLEMIVP